MDAVTLPKHNKSRCRPAKECRNQPTSTTHVCNERNKRVQIEKDIFKYISSRSQMRKGDFHRLLVFEQLYNDGRRSSSAYKTNYFIKSEIKPWILQAVDIKQHKIQRRFHLQLSVLIERFFLKNSGSDGLKVALAYFRRVISSINFLGR